MRVRCNPPTAGRGWRRLLALALLSSLLPSAARSQPAPPATLELPTESGPRWRVRELLGPERWRRLDAARFAIDLHDLDFTPALADDPGRQEELAGVLLQSFLKVSQKAVERRFRLEERRDAVRSRLRATDAPRGSAAIRVSPRVRLDDRPWLGAKLRLRHAGSKFWSGTSLRLGSEFDGRDPSVKLAFQDRFRHGYLVYHSDRDRRGEAIELLVGFSF